MHLNVQTSFLPLWDCGLQPAKEDRFLERAWCYAEWMWGHDALVVVVGVNDMDQATEMALDTQFSGFVGRVV